MFALVLNEEQREKRITEILTEDWRAKGKDFVEWKRTHLRKYLITVGDYLNRVWDPDALARRYISGVVESQTKWLFSPQELGGIFLENVEMLASHRHDLDSRRARAARCRATALTGRFTIPSEFIDTAIEFLYRSELFPLDYRFGFALELCVRREGARGFRKAELEAFSVQFVASGQSGSLVQAIELRRRAGIIPYPVSGLNAA